MKFDERDLYTGLSALHWATISTSDPRRDKSFYKGILEKAGGKALELGCGAGRLLLTFLQEGFYVQGVDISGDMLSVCRQHANAMGLDPVLYEQQMQQLDLPGRFNAIYIPCGGFQCVMGRRAALETLRRCHAHLEPGGILAFNVAPAHSFYYWGPKEIHAWPGEWKQIANKELEDGKRLLVYHHKIFEDTVAQYAVRERRYELYEGNRLIKEEIHTGQTHWYHRNELMWMLELAGFQDVDVKGDWTDETLNSEHEKEMIFVATKNGDK